jgi:uncharacterized membrane protein YidH (DUF202 family)
MVGMGGIGGNLAGKGLGHAALGDGRALPASCPGGGAGLGDVGGGFGVGGMQTVLGLLATLGAKLSLQSAAAVADVVAVHSFVILAPSDVDLVNSIAAATAHYHTLAAGMKGPHYLAVSPSMILIITYSLVVMGTVLSVVKCEVGRLEVREEQIPKVASYNVQTMVQAGRLQDVSRVLADIHIVGLQGTSASLRKAYAKLEIILTSKLVNTKILLIDAILLMVTFMFDRAPKSNFERLVAVALDRLSLMQ